MKTWNAYTISHANVNTLLICTFKYKLSEFFKVVGSVYITISFISTNTWNITKNTQMKQVYVEG